MNTAATFSKASLLALLLASACAGGGLTTGTDPIRPDPTTPTTPVVQDGQICATDGSFDFHVYGTDLGAFEGAKIWAAAIENHTDPVDRMIRTQRRPVRISGEITEGIFSLRCRSSLRETYEYPSFAVWVDADGDGRCGPGDVGVHMQLYGWDSAIEQLVGAAGETDFPFAPVEEQRGAIGGTEGVGFCQDYFP